jgi:hypothetical protein
MTAPAPLSPDDVRPANWIRAAAGSVLSAEEILSANRRIIVVVWPDRIVAAAPAVIALPPAHWWEPRELAVLDTTGVGFRLAPDGAETILGEWRRRASVRLVPLISGRAGEPDAWAVL